MNGRPPRLRLVTSSTDAADGTDLSAGTGVRSYIAPSALSGWDDTTPSGTSPYPPSGQVGGPPLYDEQACRLLLETWLIRQQLADSTITQYVAAFCRWHRWAVTEGHNAAVPVAAAVRQWSNTEPRGVSSRDTARAAIRHWCAAANIDSVHWAVDRPEKNCRRPRAALSYEQAATLHGEAIRHGRAGTAVLCSLYLGTRRSETAMLEWEQLDLDRHVARVWMEKQDRWEPKPIHPALAAHLTVVKPPAARLDRPGGGYVFAGRHGGHVSYATINCWVGKVAAAADLPHVTPHQLRKTAATLLYDVEHDILAVKRFLGHAKLETTMRYVEADMTAVARQLAQMGYGCEVA